MRPCTRWDPEVWFAEDDEVVDAARHLCGLCHARPECLTSTLRRERAEVGVSGVWGVAGGLSAPQRRRIRQKYRRVTVI